MPYPTSDFGLKTTSLPPGPLPPLEMTRKALSPPPTGPESDTVTGGFGFGSPLVQPWELEKSSICPNTTAALCGKTKLTGIRMAGNIAFTFATVAA
jgi:hypothetical protein